MNFSKIVLCAAVVSAAVSAANAVDYKACRDRVEKLEKMGESSADYTGGQAEARAILEDAEMPFPLKVRAATYLAIGCIDKSGDYAAADKVYEDLARSNEGKMNFNDIEALVGARANLFVIRCDKVGALSYIESERAKYPRENKVAWELANERFDRCVSKVYEAFFDYRGLLEYRRRIGDKAGMFALLTDKVSDAESADRLAHELVAEAKKPVEARRAWLWLWSRDPGFCDANLAKVLDGSDAARKALRAELFNTVSRGSISIYGSKSSAYFMDHATTVRTWRLYSRLCDELGEKPAFLMAQYAAIAYAALGERANAAAAARAGLEDAAINPEEKYELEMIVRLMEIKGDEKSVASSLAKADAELGNGLDADKRRKHFERAISLAVLSEDDALAHGAKDYYRSKYDVILPQKVYTVKFSDREIGGVGDWDNLPFKPEESPFDRKFGTKLLSFMLTDVATGDRGNAAQGGTKSREHPTTLQIAADEWGLHIVQTFYDARARQFESGELDAGSYECYIAPGENQPYSCILCYPKKDAPPFIMDTAYDAPGHRRLKPTDPRSVKSGVKFLDDAVRCYVALSWDSFADHVPVDGGEWDFESVFWGPIPSAWNGEKGIHARSSWGKLRFELGEAARTKILRAQLYKAANFYRSEKKPGGTAGNYAQEGCFEHWSDPVLGDVEFYNAVLKPLVAELDAAADRVNTSMTDDDVREIAEKYLSRFREIRFEVSRLRADYIRNRLLR